MRPDDGPRACGPPPSPIAGQPEPRANPPELRCVPSEEDAGQACGPRARAKRRFRPRVLETLATAKAWQAMIDTGEVKNAAQIAKDMGVTRARISQVMGLLRLAPEILDHIDDMDGNEGCLHLTERKLRNIAVLQDHQEQLARFSELVGIRLAPRTPTSPRVAAGQRASDVGGREAKAAP